MKAITIRLSQIQEQQVERFANAKRITFTEAVRLAAFSFLENDGKTQSEKAEHEKTRSKFSDIDNALTYQSNDLTAIKTAVQHFAIALTELTAKVGGAQK